MLALASFALGAIATSVLTVLVWLELLAARRRERELMERIAALEVEEPQPRTTQWLPTHMEVWS